jgi:hypothetical protein
LRFSDWSLGAERRRFEKVDWRREDFALTCDVRRAIEPIDSLGSGS